MVARLGVEGGRSEVKNLPINQKEKEIEMHEV
jgi:hypothetical protein